jgi:hypothetical protein
VHYEKAIIRSNNRNLTLQDDADGSQSASLGNRYKWQRATKMGSCM